MSFQTSGFLFSDNVTKGEQHSVMVTETVNPETQEGAATPVQPEVPPTTPAPAGEQAPAPETPPAPTPTDFETRLAVAEARVARLDKENRGKDRVITYVAGSATVQEALDRVDLKEARDADKENGLDPNAPDSAYQKTQAAIAQRKTQEAIFEDTVELNEPMTALGTERDEKGQFVPKTPEENEVAQVWGDGLDQRARRAAIKLANRYAREKAATMTTSATPKPAPAGAATPQAAKTFTEAEFKAATEKVAKEAREQAKREYLKSGVLDTTPAGAGGAPNRKQELVNRFGLGEAMTPGEMQEASAAMDEGILPKKSP